MSNAGSHAEKSQTPLIFIHGALLSARSWENYVDYFYLDPRELADRYALDGHHQNSNGRPRYPPSWPPRRPAERPAARTGRAPGRRAAPERRERRAVFRVRHDGQTAARDEEEQ